MQNFLSVKSDIAKYLRGRSTDYSDSFLSYFADTEFWSTGKKKLSLREIYDRFRYDRTKATIFITDSEQDAKLIGTYTDKALVLIEKLDKVNFDKSKRMVQDILHPVLDSALRQSIRIIHYDDVRDNHDLLEELVKEGVLKPECAQTIQWTEINESEVDEKARIFIEEVENLLNNKMFASILPKTVFCTVKLAQASSAFFTSFMPVDDNQMQVELRINIAHPMFETLTNIGGKYGAMTALGLIISEVRYKKHLPSGFGSTLNEGILYLLNIENQGSLSTKLPPIEIDID